MTPHTFFDKVIILGSGYSAHLSALALDPWAKVQAVIGPGGQSPLPSTPDEVSGQCAHSHIFLPRLELELSRLEGDLLGAFAAKGLRFTPGSWRLPATSPPQTRRLFATRWQLNAALHEIYRDRIVAPKMEGRDVEGPDIDGLVTGAEIVAHRIRALTLADGTRITPDDTTLILDAMGARSPIMPPLAAQCDGTQDQSSHIVYITQFFRLDADRVKGGQAGAQPLPTDLPKDLPDPLIHCTHGYGVAHLMLYPALDRWFSVTLAIEAENRDLIGKLRQQAHFIAFCREHPHVATWLRAASPQGPCRIFINPRNRWNAAIFQTDLAPRNYLAVGDALVSTIPTLGANCSFAATHIRIIRDLLRAQDTPIQTAFYQAVVAEHYDFFQSAVQRQRPKQEFIAYADSPQNRLSKRVKRRLRRALGLDRRRITKHLEASSSL